MSKAFTSGDDAPQAPLGIMPTGRRPITEGGFTKLQQALRQLTDVTRPALLAAAADGDIEARSKVRTIDWKIDVLTRQIGLSDRIPHIEQTPAQVSFGTQVSLRGEGGVLRSYAIVGPDEVDAAQGLVSHVSPMGRALMGLAVGDWATIKRPAGDLELEVLAIEQA